jgi:hypothetical protein
VTRNPFFIAREKYETLIAKSSAMRELPGYGQKVTKKQLEALKAATVVLLVRPRQVDGSWQSWQRSCTGVKVSIDGEDYVATAAHCFDDITGVAYGTMRAGQGLFKRIPPSVPAIDITSPSINPNEYAIGDASANPVARYTYPLLGSKVTGIAVSLEDTDIALMRVTRANMTTVRSAQASVYRRSFDDVPALPYEAVPSDPLPGQQVVVAGVPENSGDRLISNTGIYLGRTKEPLLRPYENSGGFVNAGGNRRVDVVAALAKGKQTAVCLPGASGSGGILADGHVALALSVGGYMASYQKSELLIVIGTGIWFFRDEHGLDVRVPMKTANMMCSYSVLERDTMKELVAAFGKYFDKPREERTR